MRIISISQAYRQERIQNEKLGTILKESQRDIAQKSSVIQNIEFIRAKVKNIDKKIGLYTDEYNRIGNYKNTIRKQEGIILR